MVHLGCVHRGGILDFAERFQLAVFTPQVDIQPVASALIFPLADPTYWKRSVCTILLGAKFLARMLTSAVSRNIQDVTLLPTTFGSVLLGAHLVNIDSDTGDVLSTVIEESMDSLDAMVRRLWEMEQIATASNRTKE